MCSRLTRYYLIATIEGLFINFCYDFIFPRLEIFSQGFSLKIIINLVLGHQFKVKSKLAEQPKEWDLFALQHQFQFEIYLLFLKLFVDYHLILICKLKFRL